MSFRRYFTVYTVFHYVGMTQLWAMQEWLEAEGKHPFALLSHEQQSDEDQDTSKPASCEMLTPSFDSVLPEAWLALLDLRDLDRETDSLTFDVPLLVVRGAYAGKTLDLSNTSGPIVWAGLPTTLTSLTLSSPTSLHIDKQAFLRVKKTLLHAPKIKQQGRFEGKTLTLKGNPRWVFSNRGTMTLKRLEPLIDTQDQAPLPVFSNKGSLTLFSDMEITDLHFINYGYLKGQSLTSSKENRGSFIMQSPWGRPPLTLRERQLKQPDKNLHQNGASLHLEKDLLFYGPTLSVNADQIQAHQATWILSPPLSTQSTQTLPPHFNLKHLLLNGNWTLQNEHGLIGVGHAKVGGATYLEGETIHLDQGAFGSQTSLKAKKTFILKNSLSLQGGRFELETPLANLQGCIQGAQQGKMIITDRLTGEAFLESDQFFIKIHTNFADLHLKARQNSQLLMRTHHQGTLAIEAPLSHVRAFIETIYAPFEVDVHTFTFNNKLFQVLKNKEDLQKRLTWRIKETINARMGVLWADGVRLEEVPLAPEEASSLSSAPFPISLHLHSQETPQKGEGKDPKETPSHPSDAAMPLKNHSQETPPKSEASDQEGSSSAQSVKKESDTSCFGLTVHAAQHVWNVDAAETPFSLHPKTGPAYYENACMTYPLTIEGHSFNLFIQHVKALLTLKAQEKSFLKAETLPKDFSIHTSTGPVYIDAKDMMGSGHLTGESLVLFARLLKVITKEDPSTPNPLSFATEWTFEKGFFAHIDHYQAKELKIQAPAPSQNNPSEQKDPGFLITAHAHGPSFKKEEPLQDGAKDATETSLGSHLIQAPHGSFITKTLEAPLTVNAPEQAVALLGDSFAHPVSLTGASAIMSADTFHEEVAVTLTKSAQEQEDFIRFMHALKGVKLKAPGHRVTVYGGTAHKGLQLDAHHLYFNIDALLAGNDEKTLDSSLEATHTLFGILGYVQGNLTLVGRPTQGLTALYPKMAAYPLIYRMEPEALPHPKKTGKQKGKEKAKDETDFEEVPQASSSAPEEGEASSPSQEAAASSENKMPQTHHHATLQAPFLNVQVKSAPQKTYLQAPDHDALLEGSHVSGAITAHTQTFTSEAKVVESAVKLTSDATIDIDVETSRHLDQEEVTALQDTLVSKGLAKKSLEDKKTHQALSLEEEKALTHLSQEISALQETLHKKAALLKEVSQEEDNEASPKEKAPVGLPKKRHVEANTQAVLKAAGSGVLEVGAGILQIAGGAKLFMTGHVKKGVAGMGSGLLTTLLTPVTSYKVYQAYKNVAHEEDAQFEDAFLGMPNVLSVTTTGPIRFQTQELRAPLRARAEKDIRAVNRAGSVQPLYLYSVAGQTEATFLKGNKAAVSLTAYQGAQMRLTGDQEGDVTLRSVNGTASMHQENGKNDGTVRVKGRKRTRVFIPHNRHIVTSETEGLADVFIGRNEQYVQTNAGLYNGLHIEENLGSSYASGYLNNNRIDKNQGIHVGQGALHLTRAWQNEGTLLGAGLYNALGCATNTGILGQAGIFGLHACGYNSGTDLSLTLYELDVSLMNQGTRLSGNVFSTGGLLVNTGFARQYSAGGRSLRMPFQMGNASGYKVGQPWIPVDTLRSFQKYGNLAWPVARELWDYASNPSSHDQGQDQAWYERLQQGYRWGRPFLGLGIEFLEQSLAAGQDPTGLGRTSLPFDARPWNRGIQSLHQALHVLDLLQSGPTLYQQGEQLQKCWQDTLAEVRAHRATRFDAHDLHADDWDQLSFRERLHALKEYTRDHAQEMAHHFYTAEAQQRLAVIQHLLGKGHTLGMMGDFVFSCGNNVAQGLHVVAPLRRALAPLGGTPKDTLSPLSALEARMEKSFTALERTMQDTHTVWQGLRGQYPTFGLATPLTHLHLEDYDATTGPLMLSNLFGEVYWHGKTPHHFLIKKDMRANMYFARGVDHEIAVDAEADVTGQWYPQGGHNKLTNHSTHFHAIIHDPYSQWVIVDNEGKISGIFTNQGNTDTQNDIPVSPTKPYENDLQTPQEGLPPLLQEALKEATSLETKKATAETSESSQDSQEPSLDPDTQKGERQRAIDTLKAHVSEEKEKQEKQIDAKQQQIQSALHQPLVPTMPRTVEEAQKAAKAYSPHSLTIHNRAGAVMGGAIQTRAPFVFEKDHGIATEGLIPSPKDHPLPLFQPRKFYKNCTLIQTHETLTQDAVHLDNTQAYLYFSKDRPVDIQGDQNVIYLIPEAQLTLTHVRRDEKGKDRLVVFQERVDTPPTDPAKATSFVPTATFALTQPWQADAYYLKTKTLTQQAKAYLKGQRAWLEVASLEALTAHDPVSALKALCEVDELHVTAPGQTFHGQNVIQNKFKVLSITAKDLLEDLLYANDRPFKKQTLKVKVKGNAYTRYASLHQVMIKVLNDPTYLNNDKVHRYGDRVDGRSWMMDLNQLLTKRFLTWHAHNDCFVDVTLEGDVADLLGSRQLCASLSGNGQEVGLDGQTLKINVTDTFQNGTYDLDVFYDEDTPSSLGGQFFLTLLDANRPLKGFMNLSGGLITPYHPLNLTPMSLGTHQDPLKLYLFGHNGIILPQNITGTKSLHTHAHHMSLWTTGAISGDLWKARLPFLRMKAKGNITIQGKTLRDAIHKPDLEVGHLFAVCDQLTLNGASLYQGTRAQQENHPFIYALCNRYEGDTLTHQYQEQIGKSRVTKTALGYQNVVGNGGVSIFALDTLQARGAVIRSLQGDTTLMGANLLDFPSERDVTNVTTMQRGLLSSTTITESWGIPIPSIVDAAQGKLRLIGHTLNGRAFNFGSEETPTVLCVEYVNTADEATYSCDMVKKGWFVRVDGTLPLASQVHHMVKALNAKDWVGAASLSAKGLQEVFQTHWASFMNPDTYNPATGMQSLLDRLQGKEGTFHVLDLLSLKVGYQRTHTNTQQRQAVLGTLYSGTGEVHFLADERVVHEGPLPREVVTTAPDNTFGCPKPLWEERMTSKHQETSLTATAKALTLGYGEASQERWNTSDPIQKGGVIYCLNPGETNVTLHNYQVKKVIGILGYRPRVTTFLRANIQLVKSRHKGGGVGITPALTLTAYLEGGYQRHLTQTVEASDLVEDPRGCEVHKARQDTPKKESAGFSMCLNSALINQLASPETLTARTFFQALPGNSVGVMGPGGHMQTLHGFDALDLHTQLTEHFSPHDPQALEAHPTTQELDEIQEMLSDVYYHTMVEKLKEKLSQETTSSSSSTSSSSHALSSKDPSLYNRATYEMIQYVESTSDALEKLDVAQKKGYSISQTHFEQAEQHIQVENQHLADLKHAHRVVNHALLASLHGGDEATVNRLLREKDSLERRITYLETRLFEQKSTLDKMVYTATVLGQGAHKTLHEALTPEKIGLAIKKANQALDDNPKTVAAIEGSFLLLRTGVGTQPWIAVPIITANAGITAVRIANLVVEANEGNPEAHLKLVQHSLAFCQGIAQKSSGAGTAIKVAGQIDKSLGSPVEKALQQIVNALQGKSLAPVTAGGSSVPKPTLNNPSQPNTNNLPNRNQGDHGKGQNTPSKGVQAEAPKTTQQTQTPAPKPEGEAKVPAHSSENHFEIPQSQKPKPLDLGLGKKYIQDMEQRTGLKMTKQQREELKQALRENKFSKLDKVEKKTHEDKFTQSRKQKLKQEWSKNTGQPWPYVQTTNPETGAIRNVDHQAHHVIPQQIGGPHAWWNMYPVAQNQHQGGVHGSGAPLNQIMKQVDKGGNKTNLSQPQVTKTQTETKGNK